MNIDFETFSECDINMGAFRYARDHSTDVICLAYGFDKDSIKLWYPGMPEPTDLLDYVTIGGEIRGWNAGFEYAIWNHVCAKLFNWPHLKIEQVRCTQADALALALPAALGQAAEALGLSDQKDKEGKRLINLLSKPRKATKNKPYTRVTKEIAPEEFQKMYDYCVQDVVTEMAIEEALPRKIKDSELDLFHLTLKINERGFPVDFDLVNAILKARKEYEELLNGRVCIITDGILSSTGSRPQSLKWLEDQGLKLKGYTKKDIADALEDEDISDEVREFLTIRSELSRTPIKKFDFISKAICADLTVKNNIRYHKATTGRFAGQGFQIQNLPRDASDNPEELIEKFLTENTAGLNIYNEAIKLIRPVICAPKGKKLVVSDFSSIENRVIAWLAGDEKTLQNFRDGVDQYVDAASGIYNVPMDLVTKDQRQLGKISVLSCCFGGGWKTFKKVCADSWGIYLTDDEAQEVVDGYRTKYKRVVNLWYNLYDAAMEAITTGNVTVCGKIKFRLMDDFLYMRLPSGRLLAYYKPELRMVTTPWGQKKLAITHMGTNTYTRKWERLTIIPGRLTENAVQATARDFLTEAMTNVEKAGYSIIGTVHDEIISLVNEDFGSIEHFNELMELVPEWGKGCPIDAEGYQGKRYRK